MKWSKDILPTPVFGLFFYSEYHWQQFSIISANSSQASNMTYLNLENKSLSKKKKKDALDIHSPNLGFDFFS